jgi:hypothetical protein
VLRSAQRNVPAAMTHDPTTSIMVELKGEEAAEGREADEFGITWGPGRRVTNGGTDQGDQ